MFLWPSQRYSLSQIYWLSPSEYTIGSHSRFNLGFTRTEGNLIHSLNDLNPSRLLLAAIEKIRGTQINGPRPKDEKFYIGVHQEHKVRRRCSALWLAPFH